MKISKQQEIKNVLSTVGDALFEANVLRDVVGDLRDEHKDCEYAETQIAVLESLIDERLHTLYHGVEFLQQVTAPERAAT